MALLLVAALLVACDSGTLPQQTEGDEARVGFVFAMSGDSAAVGGEQDAAARMAVDEINAGEKEPKLTPIFRPTDGSVAEAVAAYRKLINDDKVHIIIGPTTSVEARSADEEAQRVKVPVLAVSNTAGGLIDIGDYIFRVSMPEAQLIPVTVAAAKDKLDVAEVCLLYTADDAFSRAEADVFRAALESSGVKVLGEMTFTSGETDFKPQLNACKALKPDAIVVSALAGPARLILEQARKEVGIGPEVYVIGGYGFTAPEVVADPGSAEGLVVGAAWSPALDNILNKDFVEAYTKRTGKAPSQIAAQTYAGVHIAYDAAKRAGIKGKTLVDARTAVRDSLKSTGNLPTILGNFSFNDRRDAKYEPVVQIFHNGKFEEVK